MFKKIDPKQSLPKMEEEILKFWEENNVFEKTLEKTKGKNPYVFYDGPPFATGMPHYGHILTSVIKDVMPRYWTMKGKYVERKWGWDCHGLPIENIVEKELKIKRKKEIEKLGVEKFNETCRSKVLKYTESWKKTIKRLGRWVDIDNAYKTMDIAYMESVWWVFKELWDKGLIYEGYRSMHICTRCETTLSQQEVAEGYKDIKDLSVTVKFELEDEPGTYLLAWTTTPWTLIGNVALAVGEKINYAKVKLLANKERIKANRNEYYILAKDRIADILKDKEHEIINKFKGKDLIGKKYKPLFNYYINKGLQNEENGWKIYAGDFVTTEEGTGVVHIAPAFGEDDLNLSYQYKLPFIQHVGMDGIIKKEAVDFAGMSVKPMPSSSAGKDEHQKTDVEVIKYLAKNNLLFAKEKYEHSYPHCWRCDTPLINYATSSWFVNVTKIKDKALKLAKDINWSPAHIKEGRFGNWLEGARDWSISRQRFWASVIPIWKCGGFAEIKNLPRRLASLRSGQAGQKSKIKNKCKNIKIIGSVNELEKLSGQKITDLHKHIVDKITFQCEKCKGIMRRIPDVLDTWFDSGSMPYAQMHYPFDPDSISKQCLANYGAGNKKKISDICPPKSFPAEFIAEGVDQTRAWFYYLHVIATAIKDSRAYENVIVNGIIIAEDGKKMSKRLKNYPDPDEMMEKYGADALRFYFLSSPVVEAENLNFKEAEVAELVRGMFRMLWNSYSFFSLYANIDKFKVNCQMSDVKYSLLDKWIISELNVLTREVNKAMENYELNTACRLFPKFIDNLSNWYIRRSRRRFWKSENDEDKSQAYQTLYTVLVELSKLMAPFTPFVAEEIYINLINCHSEPVEESNPKEKLDPSAPLRSAQDDSICSVHLADFPVADEKLIDAKLNEEMKQIRIIISEALQLRAKAGIKVRQPLSVLSIKHNVPTDLLDIIKEEVNVKSIAINKNQVENVILNAEITEDLKLEGLAREIIRHIQEMRKEAGYEVDNRIKVGYSGTPEVFNKPELNEMIKKEVLAEELKSDELKDFDLKKEFNIEGKKIKIKIKR